MDHLADFLDNGTLPFMGREAEIERVLQWWRRALDADELLALLLVGEAGIGKSRLIAAISERIRSINGVVVHAKIYPESATTLVTLLAQGLWFAHDVRGILEREPHAVASDVIAALRRVSRLRPVLLVIEDAHLLPGEALAEMADLLAALADATLPVLCAARPVALKAFGVLERYLVDEIELRGLDERAIARIWLAIFGIPAPARTLTAIASITGGSPFAIRSALRSALRSGVIDMNGTAIAGSPDDAIERAFEAGVARLSEGMSVHLNDRERAAAERLACLGEIFARESAAALIDDADRMIDTLTAKGVVAPTTTAVDALSGDSSAATPLVFTHTLLHQHLAAPRAVAADALMRVIAGRLPLYSILPFQLARTTDTTGLSADIVGDAIERILSVAIRVDCDPMWRQSITLWEIAWSVFNTCAAMFEPDERRRRQARLANRRLALLRREPSTPEYAQLLQGAFDLTAGSVDPGMLIERMWSFRHAHLASIRADYAQVGDIWQRVHDFIDGHPQLAHSAAYCTYLRDVAHEAARAADEEMLRMVEARLNAVDAASPSMAAEAQDMLRQARTHLLLVFDTPEELADRLRALDEEPDPTTARAVPMMRVSFLQSIGFMRETLVLCDRMLSGFRKTGLDRHAFQCGLSRLCAIAAFGADLDHVAAEAAGLLDRRASESSTSLRQSVAIYLTEIGLLRGAYDWVHRIAAEYGSAGLNFWPEGAVLVAGTPAAIIEAATALPASAEHDGLRLFAGALGAAPGEAAARMLEVLGRPLLRLSDLLILHAALALYAAAAETGWTPPPALTAAARSATEHALDWLATRGLFACMTTMIVRFGDRLPRRELPGWRARIRTLQEEHAYTPPVPDDGRTHVTMIGTIGYRHAGGDEQPIRGARLRVMLGLLVCMEILRDPLSPQEFRRVAAENEADQDLARKTTNMAVARLREALGETAIVTGEDIPRLNHDVLRVDLLDAHRLLGEARSALRRRAYMRAVPAMTAALDIVHGDVPWPGLFDEIFEAVRSDFDADLRTTSLTLARELLRESDAANAEAILRSAAAAMPDDEEVAELLTTALEALGRHAEAARLRLRAADVAAD